jgi:hypothetical protein
LPAHADVPDISTGNGLYYYCTQEGDAYRAACLAYIRGAYERDQIDVWMKSPTAYTCDLPPGVTFQQMEDVVVKFLRDNPEKRNALSAGLLNTALQQAFCKK